MAVHAAHVISTHPRAKAIMTYILFYGFLTPDELVVSERTVRIENWVWEVVTSKHG